MKTHNIFTLTNYNCKIFHYDICTKRSYIIETGFVVTKQHIMSCRKVSLSDELAKLRSQIGIG